MAKSKFASMDFDFSTDMSSESAREIKDQPFQILILGDFSGRSNQKRFEPASIGTRGTFPLNRDNVDKIPKELAVELQISVRDDPDAPGLSVAFRELNDFHPDHLFESVDEFRVLRRLRRDLMNRATFAAAAREMADWGTASSPAVTEPAKPVPAESPAAGGDAETLTGASLLNAALAATKGSSPTRIPLPSRGKSKEEMQVDELVREALRPFATVAAQDPRQPQLVASVDSAISKLMARLLHHPAFQELEANWRSLKLLTRRLEIGEQLQIHYVDVSKEELQADLNLAESTGQCGYQSLVRPGSTGGSPWSMILGCYTFGPTTDDVLMLTRLAQISRLARVPFCAAAYSTMVGCNSFGTKSSDVNDWKSPMSDDVQKGWNELRNSADAAYLALVLPRFLLRTPYGKEGGKTTTFAFEEISSPRRHENFLWGNSAFLSVCGLASQFSGEGGWNPDEMNEFENLPMYIYTDDDGESQILPCAETLLWDRAAKRISEQGLVAVCSIRGRDAVQVNRLQSVAADGRALAGRWNR